jgi:hypothetical protein
MLLIAHHKKLPRPDLAMTPMRRADDNFNARPSSRAFASDPVRDNRMAAARNQWCKRLIS